MNIKKIKELKVNYREFYFVSDNHTLAECKSIYKEVLNTDKVTLKDEVAISNLLPYSKPVRSMDSRYDGVNYLILKIHLITSGYKKWLSDKSVIKAKKFNGGKSIFYKILPAKEIEKVNRILKTEPLENIVIE